MNLNFLPEKLKDSITGAVELIFNFDGPVRVISHYDADGISAAGIMSKALLREEMRFHTSMITGLEKPEVESIKKEENGLIVFMDMGSGQIDLLMELQSKIIILDHHTPQTTPEIKDNILEVNCHKLGINGTSDASASTDW